MNFDIILDRFKEFLHIVGKGNSKVLSKININDFEYSIQSNLERS